MAAYAAVVSLINTIAMERLPHHTRRFNSAEGELMESLCERATLLQEFLEGEWEGAKDLEGRIAEEAHAAEDAIESHIVDQVLSGSTNQYEERSNLLSRHLQRVIEDMDSLKIEALQVKENGGVKLENPKSLTSASSSRTPSLDENRMVGFEDEKIQIMEELASQRSCRQVISVVGMGGSGKTTLARNIYEDNFIVQRFDIRAWVTVSQEYNVGEILREILLEIGQKGGYTDEIVGEQVHRILSGKRYLIILDDIWSVECWDKVKWFLPDNNTGSRIVLTTRLSNLANYIGTCRLDMKLLDEDTSWTLFCETVFAQESCPTELEEIGKKIAQNCKGLPLSLVVIGGLLKKSSMTSEYWRQVAEDVGLAISSDADDHCLEILYSSYSHLPVHLKPCFLYMCMFPEYHEIRKAELCELWIAEGFLKPINGKSLEEIAEFFLEDLIERHLIFVDKWGSHGRIKSCKIHDVLRDLCLREALKENFLCAIWTHNLYDPQLMCSPRRIVLNRSLLKKNEYHWLSQSMQSTPVIRSLACSYNQVLPTNTGRLLRVLNATNMDFTQSTVTVRCNYPSEAIFQLVNSRYLAFVTDWKVNHSIFPSSISQLRNIQTLVVEGTWYATVPSEIWDMAQIRQYRFRPGVVLPDPTFGPNGQEDFIVLKNLHTLEKISNFRCSKEVLEKIPNIRKLKVLYREPSTTHEEEWPDYYLQNLESFQKLEALTFSFTHRKPDRNVLLQNLAFPRSLKELSLFNCGFFWEDMTLVGSLPRLEVLKLQYQSFRGRDWSPNEGEFLCLKFLSIDYCSDLVNWKVDDTHFPRLEQLYLMALPKLKELPLDIGEIPRLRLISLLYCNISTITSAKKILDEQESLGNVSLRVKIRHCKNDDVKELMNLASENFHVEAWP